MPLERLAPLAGGRLAADSGALTVTDQMNTWSDAVSKSCAFGAASYTVATIHDLGSWCSEAVAGAPPPVAQVASVRAARSGSRGGGESTCARHILRPMDLPLACAAAMNDGGRAVAASTSSQIRMSPSVPTASSVAGACGSPPVALPWEAFVGRNWRVVHGQGTFRGSGIGACELCLLASAGTCHTVTEASVSDADATSRSAEASAWEDTAKRRCGIGVMHDATLRQFWRAAGAIRWGAVVRCAKRSKDPSDVVANRLVKDVSVPMARIE